MMSEVVGTRHEMLEKDLVTWCENFWLAWLWDDAHVVDQWKM